MNKPCPAWSSSDEFLFSGCKNELTGRRRYRTIDFNIGNIHPGSLILQVEITEFVTYGTKPGRWVCFWRDATAADLAGEVIV